MITDNGTTIKMKRTFNTNIETLYNCFTSEKGWKSWWKGLDKMEVDFKVGGEILFTWQHSKAKKRCEILEIIPNEKLSFKWESCPTQELIQADNCANHIVNNTTVTFLFTQVENNKSQLELIHKLNTIENNVDGHYEGWSYALQDLDLYFHEEERKGKQELVVEKERVFNAPVEMIFELWTKPELMNKWFNSKNHTRGHAVAVLEKEGTMSMDFQMQKDGDYAKKGDVWRVIGEYREIIPNEKLVFTWMEDHQPYESLVTVNFISQDKKTLLKLKHQRFHDEENMNEFSSGWDYCLDSVESLIN